MQWDDEWKMNKIFLISSPQHFYAEFGREEENCFFNKEFKNYSVHYVNT